MRVLRESCIDSDFRFLYNVLSAKPFIDQENSCCLFNSVDELIHANGALSECKIAFLDVNLGRNQPTGIDAYKWLRCHGFSAPIYFLTAHGHGHPMVVEAMKAVDAHVLNKPIASSVLHDLIEGAKQ